MEDGSCIPLGYDALVKAVEQLSVESSGNMLKFLSPVLHQGSTRDQLEANWWVPYCENRALSRHELGGYIKMIKLTEEEKNKNVSSSNFLDDLISLMCSFSLFDEPPEYRPKGMERKYHDCWHKMYNKSMEANNDIRGLYWTDVDIERTQSFEAEQDFVHVDEEGRLEVVRNGAEPRVMEEVDSES